MFDINAKQLSLFDKISTQKESCVRTKVKFYVEGTDELIFEGHNKVILPGAAFIARCLFDIPHTEITPSYNSALNLDNTIYTSPLSMEKVFLFAVGTDGCGRENSEVYEENYGKWIAPESLVPFQYVPKTKDISNSLRSLYFGRKTLTDKFAYYFKTFESGPVLTQQYVDGTVIDNTVYTNNNTNAIETFIELRMKISKDDCRDYFIATTGINDARINSLSLLTAWFKEIDGFKYYQDVRPLTKLNIPNESLIDLLKGIDIVYQLYF